MKIRLIAVALLGLGCGSLLRSADPIAPGEFRQLQALIKPGVNEDKWATIPWGVNLWEARRQAGYGEFSSHCGRRHARRH